MTRHYATVAHARQVPVLFRSMLRHCRPFVLHVLAWDYDEMPDGTRRVMVRAPTDIRFTSRADFLARHPEMEPSRLPGPPRRPVDVVATVRWTWLADLLTELREPVTLVDGDVWLMASPEPVFAEIGAARMAVTPHRIPPRFDGRPGVSLETHACYGRYNAGWTYFADPAPAREMAAATREWSYTEVVSRGPDRRPLFGDQSALEDVAERWGAHEIWEPVNIGPWGIHSAPVSRAPDGFLKIGDRPMAPDGAVTFGGRPLIAYHFSSLRLNPDGTPAQLANPCYEVERAPGAVELIYEPYLIEVNREWQRQKP